MTDPPGGRAGTCWPWREGRDGSGRRKVGGGGGWRRAEMPQGSLYAARPLTAHTPKAPRRLRQQAHRSTAILDPNHNQPTPSPPSLPHPTQARHGPRAHLPHQQGQTFSGHTRLTDPTRLTSLAPRSPPCHDAPAAATLVVSLHSSSRMYSPPLVLKTLSSVPEAYSVWLLFVSSRQALTRPVLAPRPSPEQDLPQIAVIGSQSRSVPSFFELHSVCRG